MLDSHTPLIQRATCCNHFSQLMENFYVWKNYHCPFYSFPSLACQKVHGSLFMFVFLTKLSWLHSVKWQGLQISTTTLRFWQSRCSCLPCAVWLAPTHQHLQLKSVAKKNHNFLQDEDLSSQLSISKAVDIKLTRVGHLVKCTQNPAVLPPKWMKRQLRNNILNKDKIDAGDETQEMRVHIFGSVRSPGGGPGNPLQYSCLENPKERGAWQLQPLGSQTAEHMKQMRRHKRMRESFFQLWT